MSTIDIANNMKFLFLFKGATVKTCCCGCSLKLGTQIICVLVLLLTVANVIFNNIYNSHMWDQYVYLAIFAYIYQTLMLLGYIFVFEATFDKKFTSAYHGTIIIQINFFLTIAIGVLIFVFWMMMLSDDNFNADILIVMMVLFFSWGIGCAIYVYFTSVIFSFTKNLGLGNIDLIEGREQEASQFVSQNNYTPPVHSNQQLPQYAPQTQQHYQPSTNQRDMQLGQTVLPLNQPSINRRNNEGYQA